MNHDFIIINSGNQIFYDKIVGTIALVSGTGITSNGPGYILKSRMQDAFFGKLGKK